MRNRIVAFLLWSAGVGVAQTSITFEPRMEGDELITTSSVRLDPERLATIAVLGAHPGRAHLGEGGAGEILELLGHDPVTRLTIVRHARPDSEAAATARGGSLELQSGDALYLPGGGKTTPSRLVKWETTYDGKILPVALMRIHHPGSEPPKPGTPLLNANGELVAICHQPAPQFGNGTYALPVEAIARIESDLKTGGRVTPCWIGITVDASRTVLALEMVRPQSPGAKAGLRKGDILLSVGPRRVQNYADARNAFYYLVAGEETAMEVLRGTQKLTLKVVPEVHPTLRVPGEGDEQ